jgi:predicted small secreted protein
MNSSTLSSRNWIGRVLVAVVAVTLLIALTACNTVHGAGKDIQKGGEHIQDAAD